MSVPMIAAVYDGAKGALLMRDVSGGLLEQEQRLALWEARVLIERLAALHLQFWNDPRLSDPALGLATLEDFVTIFAPARIRGELSAGRGHPVLERALAGWERFEQKAPDDVRRIVKTIMENPAALLTRLEALPRTLVHGDYKLGNLGLERTGSGAAIVLDWQDATLGTPFLDLGYLLALNARLLPFSKPEAIELYTAGLGHKGRAISQEDQDLALTAGGPLRLLWLLVSGPAEELEWWYEMIRRASLTLGVES
jgi:hypothetical protein